MPGSTHLSINGKDRPVSATPDTPLLDVLRNEFGLMATRFGCGTESCGACMVLVDGKTAFACTLPIDAVGDKAITTLEGIGSVEHPHPLQQAFIDEQAGQCGYCLSGILVSAKALLDRNARPSRADIATALDRHLCRCGAHNRFIRAVQRATETMDGAQET